MDPLDQETRHQIDAGAGAMPHCTGGFREADVRREVISSDGLKLAAQEAGNRTGPEIVFIHGFSQCAQCWEHQFYDRC